jgi:hypothetical protein
MEAQNRDEAQKREENLTKTFLEGRGSREYLAHLHALENEAKSAKRGGWGMVQP